MTKANFLALYIVVPLIFVIQLVTGAELLNATSFWGDAVKVISPLTKTSY